MSMAKSKSKADLRSAAAALLGREGGKATAKARSPDERRAVASKAGKARLQALTPEERSAIAKKAVEARIAKYKQKRRKENE